MTSGPYTIYFASELFSFKHLLGNAAFADSIHRMSSQKYHCILPQTLEQRDTSPVAIRDQDLREVASCDLGLFHFDGPELDSGTVVEFLAAKFLDIPSVVIRTDFRKGGDGGDPWNLMVSGYPRTKTVLIDSMASYQKELARVGSESANQLLSADASVVANIRALDNLAVTVIAALDDVMATPPILASTDRDRAYEWFAKAVGGEFEKGSPLNFMRDLARKKAARGLL